MCFIILVCVCACVRACVRACVCTTMIIYVFYNIMLDIGERAIELMFPV